MANFSKPIREKGIVISKHINEARPAGESADGSRKWDAREKQYIIQVISCDEDDFSKETGILNGTLADYPVDEETYNKVKFLDWGNVKYTMSQYGEQRVSIKPISFVLIEKKGN